MLRQIQCDLIYFHIVLSANIQKHAVISPNEMHSKGGQAARRHPKIAYVCLYLDCDLLFFIPSTNSGSWKSIGGCRIPWMGTVQTVGGFRFNRVNGFLMFFVCLLPPKLLSPDFPILLVVLIIWYVWYFTVYKKNRQDAAKIQHLWWIERSRPFATLPSWCLLYRATCGMTCRPCCGELASDRWGLQTIAQLTEMHTQLVNGSVCFFCCIYIVYAYI